MANSVTNFQLVPVSVLVALRYVRWLTVAVERRFLATGTRVVPKKMPNRPVRPWIVREQL